MTIVSSETAMAAPKPVLAKLSEGTIFSRSSSMGGSGKGLSLRRWVARTGEGSGDQGSSAQALRAGSASASARVHLRLESAPSIADLFARVSESGPQGTG